MRPRGEALLAEQEKTEEGRFQKEGEDAFHGEGLSDHAAGGAGKLCPVGAELEFHGNAGNDANQKIDGKYFCPKASGFVVALVVPDQGHRLEHDDQQCQPHGQLRKQIVIGDGESEVQTVEEQRVHEEASVGTQHDTRVVRLCESRCAFRGGPNSSTISAQRTRTVHE